MRLSKTISIEIASVKKEISELETKKQKISTAVTAVETARSNVKSINAGKSYQWLKDNLDANWVLKGTNLDNTARNNIINNLDKLDGYINENSEIMSAAETVLKAAKEKTDELDDLLKDKNKELDDLNAEYEAALAAEAKAAEEEEASKDTGNTQETK